MDWSLVLTSQRIEAEILAFPDGRAPYGLRSTHWTDCVPCRPFFGFRRKTRVALASGTTRDGPALRLVCLGVVPSFECFRLACLGGQTGIAANGHAQEPGGAPWWRLVANHHRSHAAWRCRSPCFQSDLRDHYSGSLHGTLWDHPRPLDCPDLRSHGQRMELVGPR